MESSTLNEDANLGNNEGNDKSTEKNKQYSEVWNYFTKKGSGKETISECKGCKRVYKSGGKKYGTSTLRRHMESCKMLKFHDVGQMFVDHDGKLKNKKINPKIARELLAATIVEHDLPFSLVEYKSFRTWQRYVSPMLPFISRNTLVSDVNKLYVKEKAKLKQVLANSNHRVCLTSDVWTSCIGEGYICLTAHFIDENWNLNCKVLNFDHMPPPHSGVELAAKLLEFLNEWGIEKKVFSLTLDNASSNDCLQKTLRHRLLVNNSLLCGGEFFHIRCLAHILNLIVQDGLKVCSKALVKIRESVKYVKSSESRMKNFEQCMVEVGGIDSSVGLRLDVCTRWNSTYLMLVSALKYKNVFTTLPLHDMSYKWCPSEQDWKRGEKLCEFLKPFYETTNLISGSSYPTSNLYFMQVWKIESLLKENLSNEDAKISDMCRIMIAKFDKYWSEYSIILAFGAILDPRIKLQLLEHFYSKVEGDYTKCEEKVSLVKSKLYKLFECYANGNKSISSQTVSSSHLFTSNDNGNAINNCGSIFDEISAYEIQANTSAGKSQLDMYLEEPKLEFRYYKQLNVLEYWKEMKNRFPDLAMMACDVLAIPITTVASESTFSIGARVFTKYRSSMATENFQALICTRSWLHGFEYNNDDECTSTKTILSSGASNDLELETVEEGNEDDCDDVMIDEL